MIKTDLPHDAKGSLDKQYLAQRVVTGCFPEPLQRASERRVHAWYRQYLDAFIQKDIKELMHINHPDLMMKLLKLTAYYSGKLVNFSEIGAKIGLDGVTAKKYIALIEQLFLLKRLPAWHSNEYKRLVKAAKLHFTDTGLLCGIRNLSAEHLMLHPHDMGPLLETFVLNELQKQALYLDELVEFYHYRDKDKVEVDCVIENARGECFAVEVKSSASLSRKDFCGLKRLKEIAGGRFKMGVLLYDGERVASFGEGLYALPIDALWL